MNETIMRISGYTHPESLTEAHQDMVNLYPVANALIKAEWVLFDFDDTLVAHDPEAQYWVTLHTLATENGKDGQFSPDQFEKNYILSTQTTAGGTPKELEDYLLSIRLLSQRCTGDAGSFERVAQAFKDFPHNGEFLKQAIKTLPDYESTGPFWIARAKLLGSSGVPASFGKTLTPGIKELISQLSLMSKKLGIISNSRADLVLPVLDELFPNSIAAFDEILTLGGSEIPIKPASGSFKTLEERQKGLTSASSVYVGNSCEDIIFAENIGVPAIILGKPFETHAQAHFVEDVESLSRIVRRHTDGASLSRIASKNCIEVGETSSALTYDMTPTEMRGMVASGLTRLWSRQLSQSIEAYSSRAWSNEHISLKHLRNFADAFGSILGEINVEQLSSNPKLADYFTDSRLTKKGEAYGLRGPAYFTCVDPRMSAKERLTAITGELHDAIATIESIERDSLRPGDFLTYLGVLDHAKQQALTLFHAITYNERRTGIPTDAEYMQLRERLLDMAIRTTRSFYEACIGRPFTSPASLNSVSELIADLQNYGAEVNSKGLKIQELDHPLKIMMAAHNLARKQPFQTVVGFPSGGTQMAIATALATEILHNLPPQSSKVITIPLSQHSGTTKEGAAPISDELLEASIDRYTEDVKDRHVIIVDDNSSTGSTIVRGTTAIQKFGPASVSSGVGEIDPQRVLVRARNHTGNEKVTGVANMQHELFAGAAGIVPISRRDIQLRKQKASQILGIRNKRER